jgi:hypothetical protein
MTHDYKRHGIMTLFAARELHHGQLTTSMCMLRQRHPEAGSLANVMRDRQALKSR